MPCCYGGYWAAHASIIWWLQNQFQERHWSFLFTGSSGCGALCKTTHEQNCCTHSWYIWYWARQGSDSTTPFCLRNCVFLSTSHEHLWMHFRGMIIIKLLSRQGKQDALSRICGPRACGQRHGLPPYVMQSHRSQFAVLSYTTDFSRSMVPWTNAIQCYWLSVWHIGTSMHLNMSLHGSEFCYLGLLLIWWIPWTSSTIPSGMYISGAPACWKL